MLHVLPSVNKMSCNASDLDRPGVQLYPFSILRYVVKSDALNII